MDSSEKLEEDKCECENEKQESNSKYYVHPSVIERWGKASRHLWTDPPGKNDYFIHELTKNYYGRSENVKPPNPPYPFKSISPIPRAYCFDYELINFRRYDEGLKAIEDTWYRPTVKKITLMKKEHDNKKGSEDYIDPCEKVTLEVKKKEKKEIRWSKLADVTGSGRTICQRNYEMKQVGEPFRHVGISFYNKHFPAKPVKLIPIKFSK